jgi:hypothetical protein
MRFDGWKLGCILVWWLGVFIAPTTKMAVGEGCCRMVHRTVRCASHVTKPLGYDRWSSDMWDHRTVRWCTGKSLFTVRCVFWRLLWLLRAQARTVAFYCSFADDRWRCLAVTPLAHRTVRWIIAEWLLEFPKLASWRESTLVHRTQSGGAPDSPVRQTRAAFGCFAPFFLNPFF